MMMRTNMKSDGNEKILIIYVFAQMWSTNYSLSLENAEPSEAFHVELGVKIFLYCVLARNLSLQR